MAAIQSELTSGESVLWAAQPKAGVILHREDWYLIPFSLLWGRFAIFWEAGVSGFWGSTRGHTAPFFFMLWGVPFVLRGQYLIWGTFVYAAWLKKRTHYAVTNRRVIVLQNARQRKIASCYLDSLPAWIKEGGSNGTSTLRFMQTPTIWARSRGWGAWNALNVEGMPTFVDTEEVEFVYRLISDLREKVRTAKLRS
jgi:hypothetical protein